MKIWVLRMIISEKYRYLFLETPRTGSTAIAKELCELYGGREILRKHSTYYDFLKIAKEDKKEYFVFAGVRNPLDSIVSKYLKYKNNHKGRFSDPQSLVENGGWVTPIDIKRFEFAKVNEIDAFIEKFYKTPFINTLSIHHSKCNFVIKFETLSEDFTEVLDQLGIVQKRVLPVVNKTEKKSTMSYEHFKIPLQKKAVNIFGPYMREWGYKTPSNWVYDTPSTNAKVLYKCKVISAKIYCYINGYKSSATKLLPS